MLLNRPFLKLPVRFDADRLAAEVRALPESAWVPHPTGFVGNEAVRLVSPGGEETDEIEGPMGPTTSLQQCRYVRRIMGEIGGVWGRSRFMGLAPGREVPPHIDIHYYWRTHLRIHIPVITNPGVLFTCGGETVHMAAGECWVFDSSRWHDVQNKGSEQRIHLVLDTVGGGRLPELMQSAETATSNGQFIPASDSADPELMFERVNTPKVMSPWEMRCHLAFIRERAGADPKALKVLARAGQFIETWAAAWARFGTDDEGFPYYERLLAEVRADIASMGASDLMMPNGMQLARVIGELLFHMALAKPDRRFAGREASTDAPAKGASAPPSLALPSETRPTNPYRDRFERPILIVSTPRSGSTLLYETLVQAPDLYSTGNESHLLIEAPEGLKPRDRGWDSNRLSADDATPVRAEQLSASFYSVLRDRDGRRAEGRVRMLEKTPKNAVRVPFFSEIWPDAQFIYLYRDVRSTLHSMMEAWQNGGFRTYPGLPGWPNASWSLLLVPGWETLKGKSLIEIVAHQWAITTNILLDDLERLDRQQVHVIDYADFLASPGAEIERIAHEVGLSWDQPLRSSLPFSKTTVSRPDPDKWRRIEPAIKAVWPIVEQANARAIAFVADRRSAEQAAA